MLRKILGSRSQAKDHSPDKSDTQMFTNAVYYPNWAVYSPEQGTPAQLNAENISHIYYAFAKLDADGTVKLSDDWADDKILVDGTNGCLRACTALRKRNPALKVILSIGGGGGNASQNFASVSANANSTQMFTKSARAIVDHYDLDGLDIDWEHPSSTPEGMNFERLLAAIRQILPAPRYTLTCALPTGEWVLKHLDIKRIAKHLDIFNLMAYDFAGPWTPLSNHQSRLFKTRYGPQDTNSGESGVKYLLNRGFPSQRISLGIPLYGRAFKGASDLGQTFQKTDEKDCVFLYKDLPRPDVAELVDTSAGAAYCISEDCGFVSYDNPETVRMKALFVKQHKLGGIFFWQGAGDAPGSRSLILAAHEALRSS